ncbi:MAG: DNA polymerase III subunit beta [Clostridia bacterium]|nr:DNA polymerase III subunit beta [Clostridia bacterium]
MLVSCHGIELSDAFMSVSKAISNKITNPILEGIKVVAEDDTLTLSATDTELSIERKIKANIKAEGEGVVPGKFITEFIKKLTNEMVEIEINEKNQMIIRYDDSQSTIQCYNVLEYPSFKGVETMQYFGISQKDLKTIINKTIFSVAVDDSRPILKGVLFDIEKNTLNAIALDGYRLAKVKKNIVSDLDVNIVIPAKSLSEISRLLDDSDDMINIYVDKNTLMVDFGNTKVTTRLLEGDFVNYKQIIAANYETVCVINKEQFEDALERASLLSKVGQGNCVKFEVKEKNLCITSNSELGNVKENVPVNTTGKELVIAFNARYFIENLHANTDEFIKICFNSPANPCVIVPVEGDEFLYLILPVRMIG